MIRFFLWLLLWYTLVQRYLGLGIAAGGVLMFSYGTLIWSRRALQNLQMKLFTDTDRIFPNDEITVTAALENSKTLPIWVRIDLSLPDTLVSHSDTRCETRLMAWEKSRRTWNMKALRRGVFPLGSALITAGDLFGFHQKHCPYTSSREIIVYPRIHAVSHLDIQFQEFFGIHASKGLVEDPAWYAGTRDYTGNRSAKAIHWKASARLGVLQEKLYEPTSHRKVLLVLDVTRFTSDPERPEHFGSLEELEKLIETAASLASLLAEQGASFALVTNAALTGSASPALPIGRGPEHLGVLLEQLSRVHLTVSGKLDSLVHLPDYRGAGIVYLGYSPGDSVQNLFSKGVPGKKSVLLVYTSYDTEYPGAAGYGYPVYLSREVCSD